MHPLSPRAARRAVLAGAAVAALALLPAAPASAHDELVSADPAAGSTVTTALTSVDLTFAEPLVELGGHRNRIAVLDADGRHFETRCAAIRGDDLVAPVALGRAGTYRVQWAGVSDDGHLVGDTYTFTYRPPSGAAAAAGSAAGPSGCAGAATDAAAPRATGLPVGGIVAAGVGGAVLVAAVVAVVVVLVRSRRTPVG